MAALILLASSDELPDPIGNQKIDSLSPLKSDDKDQDIFKQSLENTKTDMDYDYDIMVVGSNPLGSIQGQFYDLLDLQSESEAMYVYIDTDCVQLYKYLKSA